MRAEIEMTTKEFLALKRTMEEEKEFVDASEMCGDPFKISMEDDGLLYFWIGRLGIPLRER